MFTLHYDTRLEVLADRFADCLLERDPATLLQAETVLVPQAGLETWLKQHVAARHGIAANIEFLRPAAFVWRLLKAANPSLPRLSRFERDTLRWRLFGLLHDSIDDPLHRLQAATRQALFFEQYQGYRRDLLEAWQAGAEPDDVQAGLWRALVAGAADEAPRSRLLGDYLRDHARTPPPCLPPRVLAFGCLNISPDVLAVLRLVATHTPLAFFLPTPCQAYWGDVESRREARAAGHDIFNMPDNPLLVSLGGAGREFMAGLFAHDDVQVADYADHTPPRDTLLHRVQADVIELEAPDRTGRPERLDPADRSIQLHVCHSPLREVEVLHDHLLELLKNAPELEPRDIAVLLPDVAGYAPHIDAVFGSLSRDDARYIPWNVSDRASATSHAIVTAFLQLLDLPASRLALDQVLELLAVPALARRAELTANDLDKLRDSARESGIRWGEDEQDRVAQGLPAYREFSWAFGRERVLLGYLRGDGDATLAHGIAPIADIEGDRVRAFGALLRVQRLLRDFQHFQATPHSAREWQERGNQLLTALLPERLEEDEQTALESVRAALATLALHVAAAECGEALDWQCVRACLHESLAATPARQRFLGGGVNVCGMVPLREVPFRVICVLGLDAGAYPRRDPADVGNRLEADALAGRRRRGDRSRREDDRYLFLQTLMATRDTLYLSYTGTDMRDGTRLEPSALLSEFMTLVCHAYCRDADAARATLTTIHPMRPFSPRLFDGADPRLFTYRHEWRGAATPTPQRPLPFIDVNLPPPAPAATVALVDVQRWLTAPQRAFLQQRVELTVAAAESPDSEREPVSETPLARSIRERYMIEAMLAQTDLSADALHRQLLAAGLLPPLTLGALPFEKSWQNMVPQRKIWQARMGGPLAAATPFALTLPSGRVLEGTLARHPAGHAEWVGGLRNGSHWLRWWLKALVTRALDPTAICLAFGRGDSEHALPLAPQVPAGDAARTQLDALLNEFDRAQLRPLPLLKYSSWAYARRFAGPKGGADGRSEALKAARKAWEGSSQPGASQYAERDDHWVALAFDGVALLDDAATQAAFMAAAETVHVPIWQAIQSGDQP
ncbi:MAG TPA: exodeoxyribonuclease V subunit gamma [Rhodanobacteraceae bacterium]|nr:exodeoxyribonuclease V subunit gamma [Rhodanobacteraceae bacterium]